LVKEYENASNEIDYDSGPIVCGFGAAATLMNIKNQSAFGNKNAKTTWAFFNSISCPINLLHYKFYLFQQEPMLDLFMLWAAVAL
jgi:hypothetical protein